MGGWIDVERGRLQDSTLDKSPYLEKSPQSPFANVKPTSVLTAPSTSYLPIPCRLVSSCSIVPKIIYLLASKEEMVYVRFKTPENTPPEA